MRFNRRSIAAIASALVLSALATGIYYLLQDRDGNSRSAENARAGAAAADESIELTDAQLKSVSIVTVAEKTFSIDRGAVGTIDFNQDMTVQVSPPWQGRVAQLYAKAGDDVEKGKILFTIDSPDLVQAESTLISTAGVRTLTTSALHRAKELYTVQGLSQKDYEQAVSDQQAAEAAYKAARDAVRIFGKSEAEIDKIVGERRIDARLPILSPVKGRVVARNAAPGMLVQPGGAPVPYTVADLTTKWMLASVPEADMPQLHLGQEVDVKLDAYPGRTFHGTISNIGEALDPNTRRVTVRSNIRDPKNELHPQMFATFTVHTGQTMHSPAVPFAGVVREGDGAMTVWVTTDRRRFVQRLVKVGLRQDGQDQILDGLKPGEMVAGDGALFISNARILRMK